MLLDEELAQGKGGKQGDEWVGGVELKSRQEITLAYSRLLEAESVNSCQI